MAKYTDIEALFDVKPLFEEGGKVDMCRAWMEIKAEEREAGILIGKEAGMVDKTRCIVRNMLLRNMADTDICALAECDQALVDEVRKNL